MDNEATGGASEHKTQTRQNVSVQRETEKLKPANFLPDL
jgi:hypothetical protein